MSIKTGELPQAATLNATDAMLVTTERGTEQVLFGQASAFFRDALTPSMQAAASAQVRAIDGFEAGSVRITNSQAYPFNAGVATVVLNTPRQNMDYVVSAEVTAATGV